VNGFIISLIIAIILAYFFPTALQELPVNLITNTGIGLIFFFYGLKLAPEELKLGFLNYRSHLLIQFSTFLLFPILTFLFIPLFEGGIQSELWLSVYFLGVLPSTVSSSVVMVAIARGNLPTAIFNASISGLIGILITPLWMSFFMTSSGDFDFLVILYKLFLQIVLPLILGLLLQQYFGKIARRYSRELSYFDKAVIFLIVYTSFSNSFNSGLFEMVKVIDLIKIAGIVSLLFFVMYALLGVVCKWLGFDIKDTITAKFCGTKKSLVHGSVMVKIIFGASASVGIFLLPIMLYHILQLFVVTIFAEKYRKREVLVSE